MNEPPELSDGALTFVTILLLALVFFAALGALGSLYGFATQG